MVDSHAHLWFKHFKGEVSELIERAKKAGVTKILCVGCDEESSRQSVELAEQYEEVYAVAGVHPCEVNNEIKKRGNEEYLKWVTKLIACSKKIVAIGETGLDYYHEPYDAELQKKMFRAQCELANEFGLPVVVHLRWNKETREHYDFAQCRQGNKKYSSGGGPRFLVSSFLSKAEQECLKVLDEAKMPADKVVFHCFPGGLDFAGEVLERGWVISFAGPITYPSAGESRELVKIVPLDKLLVETDCPFLAPQKYRGGRNEPAYVVETARKVAEIKGVEYEELDRRIRKNAERVFGRGTKNKE